jgi:phospholipid/cholesterol/gamma-HCH transport system substrate-binding protein
MTQISRSQKVRLGIFLAAGLTVLVGGLVILAGLKLGEKRDRYLIRYHEADVSLSGLEVGSPVKYSGIRVGRVDSVRIDPADVGVILVEISLDHRTPVAEDTRANLGSQGITGLKYIELSRGSSRARVREPGEEIPAGTSLFDSLASQAGDIAAKVEGVLDRVADLSGPETKERIGRLLDRSETLLATIDATVSENRAALGTLATRLSGTAAQVERLSAELAGTARRVNALLDETTLLVKNARLTPERLNVVLEQGAGVLTSLNMLLTQSRRDLVEAIGYLRETAENTSALSQKLRDDPTLLLRGESDEGGEP